MLVVGILIPFQTACYQCLERNEQLKRDAEGATTPLFKAAPLNAVIAPTATLTGHLGALEAIYGSSGFNGKRMPHFWGVSVPGNQVAARSHPKNAGFFPPIPEDPNLLARRLETPNRWALLSSEFDDLRSLLLQRSACLGRLPGLRNQQPVSMKAIACP